MISVSRCNKDKQKNVILSMPLKYLRKLGRKILYLYHIPTDPCLRYGFTGVLKIEPWMAT